MPQRITGHTELIGLIATPIRHSKSPMMHNTAFEALGLDYAYLAFDFQPDRLEDAVKGLKALGAKGWNVSMPYKTDIIPLLDEISEVSRLCESVNTVINRDGKLYGTVTDGTGYMSALADQGFDIKGKKMTVLGCGGAATAICIQAALDGVKEISIFNAGRRRTPPRSMPTRTAWPTPIRWRTPSACARRSRPAPCWPTPPTWAWVGWRASA